MCFHASLSQMIQGRVAFGGRISTAKAREKHKHWKSNVLLIQADGVQGFSCKVVSCFFIHLVMIPTQFGGRVWFTNVHQQECAALLHPIILCVPYLIILGDLVASINIPNPADFVGMEHAYRNVPLSIGSGSQNFVNMLQEIPSLVRTMVFSFVSSTKLSMKTILRLSQNRTCDGSDSTTCWWVFVVSARSDHKSWTTSD